MLPGYLGPETQVSKLGNSLPMKQPTALKEKNMLRKENVYADSHYTRESVLTEKGKDSETYPLKTSNLKQGGRDGSGRLCTPKLFGLNDCQY